MRVTVTGATGTVGSALVRALLGRGDEVTVLSRDPDAAVQRLGSEVRALAWEPTAGTPPLAAIEHAEAVVNLAGESVAQRWTDAAKASIRSSRVDGTRHLVQAIATVDADRRPVALVSGSAIGYYGDRRDEIDESAPAGTGFLADLAAAWEAEAVRAEALGVRVARIRTGDVLAADAGVLPILERVTKLGVMGPLGGGRQPFPWIHVDDEVGVILHAVDSHRAAGPINAVAPGRVTQREFARALGRQLRRPAFAPGPAFAVRLLVGEMAELILEGAAARPAAAVDLGYAFAFPALDGALRDLLS